jgi:hypothetical protein
VKDISTGAEVTKSNYESWIDINSEGNLTVKDFTVPREVQIYVQATAGTVWSTDDFSVAKF